MNDSIQSQPLSLLDEFILMLLDEESGYFYQIPAQKMNCAIIGAALAELSLLSRIDTDMESLDTLNPTETGNSGLDLILKKIVDEPVQHNAQYWMEDCLPDPFSFDIDRYLPPRNEHRNPGYAPYGLGSHTCLGIQFASLCMAVNLLIVAHYFTLRVHPEDYELRISPFPSMKPNKKLKFRIAEQKHELPIGFPPDVCCPCFTPV